MAFRTSFFNPTLYKKTMHRFWPLWAAYTVCWLFAIPLNLLNQYFDAIRWPNGDPIDQLRQACYGLLASLQPGVLLAAGVGLVAALAVFGYLYNNRSAAMMHMLPLRRQDLFFTQYLAGVSMFLLPQLVCTGLGALVVVFFVSGPALGQALSALATCLLVQCGTTLFFYSFAVFCAMFTGHVLALPVFYGILNALVVTIYSLVNELMALFFYGYVSSYDFDGLVKYLTPVYALTEACHRNPIREYYNALGDFNIVGYTLESPGTVLAYVVAGLALTALALFVYRRRHVESAGDVVSVAVVRPVFQVGVAFCVGLCLGTLTAVFFGWERIGLPLTACVLLWTVVGWFAAAMLLKKSFRVFRSGWRGCTAMLGLMLVLCAACAFDWFGVETKVPSVSAVKTLHTQLPQSAPYDDGNWADVTLTDPEDIQKFIDLHHAVLRNKDRNLSEIRFDGANAYTTIRFTYELADGTRLMRRYNSVPLYLDELKEEGSLTWHCQRLLDDRDLVKMAYRMEQVEQGEPISAVISPVTDPYGREYHEVEIDRTHPNGEKRDLNGLWAAVQADFEAGTLGKRWLFDTDERFAQTYESSLFIKFLVRLEDNRDTTRHLSVTLTPTAQNTLAWLEEQGVLTQDCQLIGYKTGSNEPYPVVDYILTTESAALIAGIAY